MWLFLCQCLSIVQKICCQQSSLSATSAELMSWAWHWSVIFRDAFRHGARLLPLLVWWQKGYSNNSLVTLCSLKQKWQNSFLLENAGIREEIYTRIVLNETIPFDATKRPSVYICSVWIFFQNGLKGRMFFFLSNMTWIQHNIKTHPGRQHQNDRHEIT